MTSFTFRKSVYDNFLFEVVFDCGIVSMYFFDPKAGDISDFEAVSNGLGKITFCDSNGVVVINANGKTVSFEISKQGDGVIRLNLPFETCRQALLESFEARKLLGDNYD